MPTQFTVLVLCIFMMQTASADCVAPSVAAAPTTRSTSPAAQEFVTAPPAAQRGELIKSAAAGTREPIIPVARSHARSEDTDPSHHGGKAMLLAALALMSGIALRRYGAARQ